MKKNIFLLLCVLFLTLLFTACGGSSSGSGGENDGGGGTIGVTVTESLGTTDVSEDGATDTFTIVLMSEPGDTVTITVAPDSQTDLGSGAATAITLIFTTANWNVS